MPLSLFTVTVKEYEHIRFDASDASLLQLIIWGVCIGAVLASLLSFYQQRVPGGLVRALLQAEAHDENTAKSLAELGLAGKPLLARELRRSTSLQKLVRSSKDGAGQCESPSDGETAHADAENGAVAPHGTTCEAAPRYYIPEELKYRAATRFDKKESSLLSLGITVILAVAIAVLILKLLPLTLSMVDAVLSS